jgi:hypothetical protein
MLTYNEFSACANNYGLKPALWFARQLGVTIDMALIYTQFYMENRK